GFWLLLARPTQLPAAFAASGALLLLFTGWMAWVNARRLRIRCGCFGAGEGEVGPRTMLRNAGLLALALLGWALAARIDTPGLGPTLPAFAVALALALCVALVQAARLVLPHLVVTDARFGAGSTLGEAE
ncbi:MAG: hypothetical protein IT337_05730, partial [Thermomicrobiales bacterium]|nr:hypothetical protein [Thermomicrobiales bacterium]